MLMIQYDSQLIPSHLMVTNRQSDCTLASLLVLSPKNTLNLKNNWDDAL